MRALALLLTLAAFSARADAPPHTGVICLAPLPPASAYATAGKGASTPESYRDDAESRAARVKQAQQRPPAIFSVGEVKSGPVTSTDAQCIDQIPLGTAQVLRLDGEPLLHFTLTEAEPVRRFSRSAFYASDRLDPVPARLYCPKRAATPDCSWCPCKARHYAPPPARSRPRP